MFFYSKRIGNLELIINSDIQLSESSVPHDLPEAYKSMSILINLRANPIERIEARRRFNQGSDYLPNSFIEEDYVLTKYDYAHRKIGNKYNKFKVKDDEVIGYFPYQLDDFYILYKVGSKTITIFGNEFNLNRIISDILTMYCALLPVHCACINYRHEGIVFLGESNSGKSLITDYYVKQGADYISDDYCLIKDNNAYRLQNSISVRCNNDEKRRRLLVEPGVGYVSSSLIDKVFLIEEHNKETFLKKYKKSMFPSVTSESVWCCDVLGIVGEYERLFRKSLLITYQLIERAELFSIRKIIGE